MARIEAISNAFDIFLVIGVIERDGGTLYCTTIFVDPREGYLAKHRKLMPTAAERFIWGQGDGSTLPVLERQFDNQVTAKLSAAICWYVPRDYTYLLVLIMKGELYAPTFVDRSLKVDLSLIEVF